MTAFEAAALALLREARVVVIETTSAAGAEHRAKIWVVADDEHAYVRSWRGDRGRWYRELRDRRDGTLIVGERRLAVRAIPATDEASVALVSSLLEAKYARRSPGSTREMQLPQTLPTTLRLERA